MRVAYVCADPGVPVFGTKGASVHVQELIRAFRRAGARVELMATRFGGDVPDDLVGMKILELPSIGGGDAVERERQALAANDALGTHLRRRGPHDLVYERYSLWSHAAMSYAQNLRLPSVLEVNSPLIDEQARHRELVGRAAAQAIARRVFDAAGAVVAVSNEVAEWVSERASPGKVHVIPNGVDPARFSRPQRRTGHGAPFAVGFVGTLKPWHGVETLVDALGILMREDGAYRLLVVGDGPQLPELRRRATDLGISSSVTFTGSVDPTRIPRLLACMDAAVAPYPELPGFYFSPLKLFEYLAAGLPVVASAIGQIEEVVTDRVTALLCPPGDAVALARALKDLRNSPGMCRTMGRAGRDLIERTHTWDSVVERIMRLTGNGAAEGVA
jgi:glycosyltransferase involved in cell wall biosynthesis